MTAVPALKIPLERLRTLAESGPTHLQPLCHAMRTGACSVLQIPQGSGRFAVPPGRGIVAIVGDDRDTALGPDGFHRKSIERLARAVDSAAVLAGDIVPEVYAGAANATLLGFSTLIVETRPEWEGAWLELFQRAAPRTRVLLCTVAEGTA